MRRFYARVEHKVVVGNDLFNLLAVTSIILIRYQSHVSVRVRSVWAASSHNTVEQEKTSRGK